MAVKYRPNSSGLEQLVRGHVAQKLVNDKAEEMAQRAGDGFVASGQQRRARYGAIVYADSWSAKRREARENRLVKVLFS